VEETDTHVAVQAVRRHELDVALVRQLATPPGCVRATLRTEPFVVAVPAPWAVGRDRAETLARAAELPWIWLPRTISPDYHDQVVACCRAAGFVPEARHTARSIASQLAMVACGLGVAIVPHSATRPPTRPPGDEVAVVQLEDSPTIELAAVWRRGANPLVEGLLRSIHAVLGSQ
jgi:DNA-binding transcriptional LysR family regulator